MQSSGILRLQVVDYRQVLVVSYVSTLIISGVCQALKGLSFFRTCTVSKLVKYH